MYDWLYYSQVDDGYMCNICEFFYGKSPVPTGRGRGAWSHNAVIFHGNAGKKLQCHAKQKLHTNAILAITFTRTDEALLGPTGIQEKTNTNKMYVSKLIKIVHFLGKHNLPIQELYPVLLHFLAFDLEEPVTKQYLGNCPKNTTYNSHNTPDSLISALNEFIKKKWTQNSEMLLMQ